MVAPVPDSRGNAPYSSSAYSHRFFYYTLFVFYHCEGASRSSFRAMRILITNDQLDRRAGADLFVRDLARYLNRAGHFVFAYGSDLRQNERFLERDSIAVATDLERLPFRPDIIHARHHLDAMTAVLALPGVPAIYHQSLVDPPISVPRHPRIYRYVAPTEVAAERLVTDGDLDVSSVDVVARPVDRERFAAVRKPAATLSRALLCDDRILPHSPVVVAIRSGAGKLGLELDLSGRNLGRVWDRPEKRFLLYDVVFASGQTAVEALASGCSVVATSPRGCGELINDENYEHLRAADFEPPPGVVTSADTIVRTLGRYSAAAAASTPALVRREGFALFAERLVAIYGAAIERHRTSECAPEIEQRAAADYFDRLMRVMKEVNIAQKDHGDMPIYMATMWLDVSARIAAVQAEADKPRWW